MNTKNFSPSFAAALLILATPITSFAAISDDEINALDSACMNVTNLKQAQSCLQPFYYRALTVADHIWDDLHSSGKIDVSAMTNTQKQFYKSGDYDLNCKGKNNLVPNFKSPHSVGSHMRTAQHCLSYATDLADKFDVSYDKDEASYLIARARRLSHLDIQGMQ